MHRGTAGQIQEVFMCCQRQAACLLFSRLAVCGMLKREDCFCPETYLSERFVKYSEVAEFSADVMLSCDRWPLAN